jgi:hypothetical protein
MAKRFLIKESTAIKLFKALGFVTAENWTTDRLQKKLNNLPEITDETKVGEWAQDYLDRIERAEEVIIKESEQDKMAKKDKKKNKGKGKKKEKAEVVEEKVEAKKSSKKVEKKKDKKKKAPKKDVKKNTTKKKDEKKTATKKVGVIATIVECLKKGPTTRESILKVLVKRFPDRAKDSMNTTVKAAVPSYLTKQKGFKVQKDDKERYFIK